MFLELHTPKNDRAQDKGTWDLYIGRFCFSRHNYKRWSFFHDHISTFLHLGHYWIWHLNVRY